MGKITESINTNEQNRYRHHSAMTMSWFGRVVCLAIMASAALGAGRSVFDNVTDPADNHYEGRGRNSRGESHQYGSPGQYNGNQNSGYDDQSYLHDRYRTNMSQAVHNSDRARSN